MSKSELNRASLELEKAMAEIEKIALEYPSILIYKDDWAFSLKSECESFRKKLDLFRRDMVRFGEVIPKKRRRK